MESAFLSVRISMDEKVQIAAMGTISDVTRRAIRAYINQAQTFQIPTDAQSKEKAG